MGRHLSPRYGQVILVSGYLVLTAVNRSQHWCSISFLLGSQKKLESVKVNIGFPVVRTDGLSGGRCTVTWSPNFLGWVDLLSYGTPPTRARSVRVELGYQFDGRSTNSTFLYCKERLFHTQGETCDKLKLFPRDPGREFFLQLPCELTTSSNNVFRWGIRRRYKSNNST